MINSVGGSPMMMPGFTQRVQQGRQQEATGEATASARADDRMARQAQPQVPATAGRAMTEAKGMFVDMYA